MLEDLGVHIVEADWLAHDAVFVRCADALLIRPDADAVTWDLAAKAVLMPRA